MYNRIGINLYGIDYYFKEAFELFTFENGTPFGKLV